MCKIIDINGKFNDITHIGNGTYGNVYSVLDKTTNHKYAMKISYIDRDYIINPIILREISNLIKNQNEYTVKLFDVDIGLFHNKKCIFLLLELCDKTLFKIFENNEYDSNLLSQIIKSINNMHKSGYYHGDLSFTNIMIKDNNIRIIDFGYMGKIHRKHDNNFLPSVMVKPIQKIISGIQIDNWSLGCIYYKFKTGKYLINPMENDYMEKFLMKHKQMNTNENFTNNNKTFLNKLLNNNYKNSVQINTNNPIINYKKNNIFSKLIKNNMFNIVAFIGTFIKNNCLESELLYLTIINSKKIKSNCKDFHEIILHFVITFWVTNIMVSQKILGRGDIITLLKKINVSPNNLENIYYDILKQLKWDADDHTLYEYIKHIPNKLKDKYEFLILYLEITNYCHDNMLNSFNGIINIFREYYDDHNYDELNKLIKNSTDRLMIRNEKYQIQTHIRNFIKRKPIINKLILDICIINNSDIYDELDYLLN